jgi:hypothetical protein
MTIKKKKNIKPKSLEKKRRPLSKVKASKITLVDLGRLIEIDTSTWTYTFTEKDNFRLASSVDGSRLFMFAALGQRATLPVKTDYKKGARLFERFSGHRVDGVKKGRKNTADKAAGIALHVIYESDKFSNKKSKYIHVFESTPKVFVDNVSKPSIIEVGGGKITVTSKGIEG